MNLGLIHGAQHAIYFFGALVDTQEQAGESVKLLFKKCLNLSNELLIPLTFS